MFITLVLFTVVSVFPYVDHFLFIIALSLDVVLFLVPVRTCHLLHRVFTGLQEIYDTTDCVTAACLLVLSSFNRQLLFNNGEICIIYTRVIILGQLYPCNLCVVNYNGVIYTCVIILVQFILVYLLFQNCEQKQAKKVTCKEMVEILDIFIFTRASISVICKEILK